MDNFKTPDEIFQELFVELHLKEVLTDGKSISDALPKTNPEEILAIYRSEKDNPDFDIKTFFQKHFELTAAKTTNFQSDMSRSVQEHIEVLWEVLKRDADQPVAGSSRIPLQHPYIVPGGRFNEIYYWDSYFTMLGLQVSGRIDIIKGMIDNFSWMIDNFGFIPNGNRTYFMGRSQPPFYALMISLLAEEKGDEVFVTYLNSLEKEYDFWMSGLKHINLANQAVEHVVKIEDKKFLNRYYDRFHQPRAEMYATDVNDLKHNNREAVSFYLDIRSACESGWDFSARWFDDPMDLGTIRTSKILAVDLNCLLYYLEKTIAKANLISGNHDKNAQFNSLADQRKERIATTFWNADKGYFYDYDFERKQFTTVPSLAGVYPLFFKLATSEQAEKCAQFIRKHFLRDGGVVSTKLNTGQQWDAPNGWAPLQWMTIKGLRNYGHHELANEIKNNWVKLNQKVYKETGKMMEKYNVEDINLLSGGGEYDLQDGFGWTNGVLLKLLSEE